MNPRSCNPEELHGMTVVLDTAGPKVYVGRFDQALGDHYVVNDLDIFEDGRDGLNKADYLRQAAAYGVWVKEKQYYVPAAEVVSIRKLIEYKAAE